MNTANTSSAPGISYQPLPLEQPNVPLLERINWRAVVFGLVVLGLIGIPFYLWLSEVVTGGIHNVGEYKEVDLKAMSTFDMDQQNAAMDDIPQRWRALEGQKVIMIGEMWAPQSAGDGKLSYFQLVYSKTKCCFSGPPLAQHFVDGNVISGKTAYYFDVPVRVYGTLHVGLHKEGSIIKSIYHVDVAKVEPIEG